MLTNPEVIAVDQDPLGVQCVKVSEPSPGLEVWSKRLMPKSDGRARRAIVLLNRTDNSAAISINWAELGLLPVSANVRNLWKRENVDSFQKGYSATVSAGDAEMFLVEDEEAPPLEHLHATVMHGEHGNLNWNFSEVKPIAAITWIRANYLNASTVPCALNLDVNDVRQSVIVLPPTANRKKGSVTIALKLPMETRANEISLRGRGCSHLKIDTVDVLAGK